MRYILTYLEVFNSMQQLKVEIAAAIFLLPTYRHQFLRQTFHQIMVSVKCFQYYQIPFIIKCKKPRTIFFVIFDGINGID